MGAATRKTIGTFEIERELGQGGMGVVYLARQPELERRVVLKTLHRHLADKRKEAMRFIREAQTAASVHHQNVVAVYDCFAYRGERYIAQEYVEGADLCDALQLVRRLAPRVAALIALELARGLEEIHARGLVHRDIKPSNILLGRGGEAKIADFGIVLDGKGPALTQVGLAIGTPPYMSPEQILGERVDVRSDVFTLGVVLYEMLTGEPPFPETDSDKGEALVRRIEAGRYVRPRKLSPETPRRLARLLHRCLRAKPKKRPQSAAELRLALEQCLGTPSPAECRREIAEWLWERGVFEAEDDGTRLRKPPKRRRRWIGAMRWAIAGLLAAVVGATVAHDRGHLPDLSELNLPAFLVAMRGDAATPERSPSP